MFSMETISFRGTITNDYLKVVWDRLHVDFKNGEAKQEAWNEICPNFVPFYNELDEDEQLAISKYQTI